MNAYVVFFGRNSLGCINSYRSFSFRSPCLGTLIHRMPLTIADHYIVKDKSGILYSMMVPLR